MLEVAGGRQIDGQDGFGCRILVIFEGAGFELSFSVFLPSLAKVRRKIVPVL
jgi:hypothetical protein